ncbi:MAG: substrate-binding domain-containing protein [Prevotella sp.]|jgi:ABC-type sugar transport system substrate-binding protein|nr:substrate-binding domain-containing protein [Prevotella sp.]
MQKILTLGTVLSLALIFLAGCAREKPRYVIGVSQCSEDIWREKQNAELRMGAYLQDNVELRFAAAYDSDERQVQQIDSLVATGIDLLIVAPNQIQTISPAIDRAFDKGIPVIVFERKTNSQKYTAFISADNYEMGRVMGRYVASQLHGKGHVLEVMGLKGSSPAIERHNGFTDALKDYPGIEIVDTLQGDWTEESAYNAMKQWLERGERNAEGIDYVFGQNDRMAMGARRAMQEVTTPLALWRGAGGEASRFCGIDGLPGEDGGIRLVRDSILDASYIYPTHGDKIIERAIDILEGKPYEKETHLMSALVTHDNARVLLMQNEEIMHQSDYLDQLHHRADNYLQELGTQRAITWLACAFILLLLIVFVLFYMYHLSKVRLRHERVVNNLWNMETPQQAQPQPLPVSEGSEYSQDEVPVFITRFKEAVEARLDDSDVSVEDLAADMNLSRVQLYRKVKAITGSSPVELLRTARLNRGYQLLLTTDLSISEVAYQVGFTAPSYFTKCFKEEFGLLPGDLKN